MNSPCPGCPHVQHIRDLADPTAEQVRAADSESHWRQPTLCDELRDVQLVMTAVLASGDTHGLTLQLEEGWQKLANVIQAIEEH